MAALSPGAPAPKFALPLIGGERFRFDADAYCLLAFFKVSCPTCQYTFPFLERLYQNKLKAPVGEASAKVQIFGVSQDDEAKTLEFAERFGVTFPILLDDAKHYAVSNAYGLTNVPTMFLISAEGLVEFSSVGWSREEMEALNSRITNLSDGTPVPLFRSGEEVQLLKAG